MERIEGLELFIDMYPAFVNIFELIKNDSERCWSNDSSVKASGLDSAVTRFGFIISLIAVTV